MIDREKLDAMIQELCNTGHQRTLMYALVGELEVLATRVRQLEEAMNKPKPTHTTKKVPKKATSKATVKTGGVD